MPNPFRRRERIYLDPLETITIRIRSRVNIGLLLQASVIRSSKLAEAGITIKRNARTVRVRPKNSINLSTLLNSVFDEQKVCQSGIGKVHRA